MILTITLNPSVDISYNLDSFMLNKSNRCSHSIKTAGGKGLNVARVVKQSGLDVIATGFKGGSNGCFLSEELKKLGIDDQFVQIEGQTRNCIAILHDRFQTEILEKGPYICEHAQKLFLERFEELLENAEIVTVSGSLPEGLPSDYYKRLIEMAHSKGKKLILDTSGIPLRQALSANPWLIKPNYQELCSLVKKEKLDGTEIMDVMADINAKFNVKYVMVSLGSEGAIGLYNNQYYKIMPPTIQAVNPVGSGDASVAGFAVAAKKGMSGEEVFRLGCTYGTLNALQEQTGFIDSTKVEKYFSKTMIVQVNR